MALDVEKSEPLRSALDDLEVEPDEVFNESFLKKFTPYEDFGGFLDTITNRPVNGSIPAGITIDEVDRAVKRQTGFDSWNQMFEKALREYWEDPSENRRKHTRFNCDVTVRIETGLKELAGRMLDVSSGGLRVRTGEEVPNVRFLNVSIPLDEFKDQSGTLDVRATIQWRDENSSATTMGLEILSKRKVTD